MSTEYTLNILSETGLLGVISIEPNHQLVKTFRSYFDKPDRYRRLIGKLVFLTLTQPELVYTIHTLTQFMHAPRRAH